MNYYSHNIGDYAQATMHLTLIEDAIYSRLLRRYYAEEQPIKNDMAQVCRWVGARSEEEKQAVETVLNEFFVLESDAWTNKRADAEIVIYREKSDKAASAANKRWSKPGNASAMQPHSEGNTDAIPTKKQEPLTNNQETETKAPAVRVPSLSVANLEALGVESQTAVEFLAVRKRKRAPLTELAMDGIRREAASAGWTINAVLKKCVERGWQSFEAGWVEPRAAPQAQKFDPLAYVNRNRIKREVGDVVDM